jgi:nitrogenase molybdenum-iron protein beta chain
MAATSSFTEGASVFGGQANLLEDIANIFNLYNPMLLQSYYILQNDW